MPLVRPLGRHGCCLLAVWALMGGLLALEPGAVQAQGSQPRHFQPGLGPRTIPLPLSRLVERLQDTDDPALSAQKAQAEAQLAQVEARLYGRMYPDDTLKARLERVERTLFGQLNPAPRSARLQAIAARLAQAQAPGSQAARQPDARLTAYMETRLFGQTFEALSAEQRLSQLEAYVFGRTFPAQSKAMRLRQLSYALPLGTREIRLSSDGVVTASARADTAADPPDLATGLAKNTLQEFSAEPASRAVPTTSATAIRPAPQPFLAAVTLAPVPAPASALPVASLRLSSRTPDYGRQIFTRPDGAVMRWATLPVRIYTDAPTIRQQAMVEEALQHWRSALPLVLTPDPGRADIVIAWTRTPAPEPTPMTRPILTLDAGERIRTAVLVDMAAATDPDTLNPRQVTHALGHALGLWGHSEDPHDLMYPAYGPRPRDIPQPWERTTLTPSPAGDTPDQTIGAPSPRDISTLRRLYEKPADDLARYSPYR